MAALRRRWFFPLALVLCAFLWCPGALGAQGLSDMRGTVVDSSGGALPGVQIVITNQATGTFREVTSNADGSWYVPGLTPGAYQVSAELAGFKRFLRRDLAVVVGTTATVPVSLELGALEETITVTSEAPLIDVTSKQIGGNLDTKDLTQLPSISRNWLGFAALLPGVVPSPNLASWGSETISANGVDTRNNSFLVDGAWDNDDYLGQNNGGQVRVPIEGVQESQVLIGQYDAEFGRTSGAIVNAVTKSGTNKLHGAGFMFYTNKALRAVDYFVDQNNLEEPDPTKQEWGGALGGPIIKDKAHFFGNLERVSINEGRTIQIPQRPELNWATVTEVRAWNALTRFDHQINANHSWSFRWLGEWSPQTGQTNNLAVTPAGRQREWDLDQHSNVSVNSVLGRNIVNQFRFGWTREDDRFAQNDFSACPSGGFNACSEQNLREQQNVGASLSYLTFLDGPRNVGTHWITNSPEISETLSWFIPDKKGDHDLKFGAKYYFTEWRFQNHAQINGQFVIPSNNAFNPADPRTYPERLTIQVPADFRVFMKQRAWAIFAQDKWRLNNNLTFNLGLRYDLEYTPLDVSQNPYFASGQDYPLDKNNLSPRAGLTWSMDEGRSLIRSGYGLFYDKVNFGMVQDFVRNGINSQSFVAQFPADRIDPGPRAGQFPTDPLLVNGPIVNRTLLNQLFPQGSTPRNRGVVWLDRPDRHLPYIQQVSLGYQRQLGTRMSVAADYVHTYGRDLFMVEDLNAGVRATTAAGGVITRPDPQFVTSVNTRSNVGSYDYDGLNVQLEKRESNGWSGRVSYTLSYSRGNTNGEFTAPINFQLLNELNLDANQGPTDRDRRHNLVISGRGEIPKTKGMTLATTIRMLSGLPFTILNTSTDPDRNGILFDPLPSGTYKGNGVNAIEVKNDGGRNGAYGPGFIQADVRLGWRWRLGDGRTADLSCDFINVANRANFLNPSGDQRLTNFLLLTALSGGGQPRQAQVGLRIGF
jgi:Carboxypeptidase regulatory-like domain/TonB dependent receptor